MKIYELYLVKIWDILKISMSNTVCNNNNNFFENAPITQNNYNLHMKLINCTQK